MPVYNTKKKKIWNKEKCKWEWINKSNQETAKDGREWYFSTYYNDLQGNKKKYKSKKFATANEAKEEERLFLMKVTDKISTKDLTFKDVYKSYLEFQKSKIKITTYSDIIKRHKKLESLDNIKVKNFNLTHFNQWKEKINKEKYSVSYKNGFYKELKALLKYASIYLNISNNTINKMTNFVDKNSLKKEMLFFTKNEFDKFISAEDDLTFKTFFSVLYYCGLRQGEAQALTWKDINFDKNELSITKSLTTKIKGEKYVILPPKTKSSIRILPMPKVVLNSLKSLFLEKKKYINFNYNWFVFGDIYPIPNTTIQYRKNNDCKLANVKQIRIHDFRHSCASLLINNNASISLVARYLGHSNIAITLNTYSHMYKSQLDDIIKTIDSLE